VEHLSGDPLVKAPALLENIRRSLKAFPAYFYVCWKAKELTLKWSTFEVNWVLSGLTIIQYT
jgi:hypothetical protein